MVHILLKLGLENFEHYFTSLWGECNCVVVWTFSCDRCWVFQICWPIECSISTASSLRIWNAAAAKSLQSCLTARPHRWQPNRLLRPWDSPGKNTGVGCHFLLQCMKVKSEREVAQSCPTLSDPMDCSLPGSLVHGFLQARLLEWVAISFSNKYIYIYISIHTHTYIHRAAILCQTIC